jgi:pimeloyl-ACP methyl ester carboxylesterase
MKTHLNSSIKKGLKALLPALLSLAIAGCSNDDDSDAPDRGALLSSESLQAFEGDGAADVAFESWVSDLWNLLVNCASEGVITNAWNLIVERQANFRGVTPVSITYESATIDGKRLELTGALLIPTTVFKQNFPLIGIQHGTQLLRLTAPSKMAGNPSGYSVSDAFEVWLGYLVARSGYIVALADYPGMGDKTSENSGFHPYVHGRSLAISVVDMLRASRTYLDKNKDKLNVSWNGQLFLMGYSEGGYVTLATAREIQQKHVSEFTVTAATPLDGPHDLTGVMLPVMQGKASNSSNFPAPYFLPYVIKGYETIYGAGIYGPKVAYATEYVEKIPPLMDGYNDSKKVSCTIAEIQKRPSGDCSASLPLILSPGFLADLGNSGSAAFKNLRSNDLYLEDLGQCSKPSGVCIWIPQMPMGFFHHPDDDLVPFQNSQNAFDQFKNAGATKVELNRFQCQAPLGNVMHVNAALPALVAGYGWLDKFRQ